MAFFQRPLVRRLARAAAVLICLGISSQEAAAIWVPMTLEQLVKESQFVVIGELVAIRGQAGEPRDVGTIRVDEVIVARGAPKQPAELLLAIPARGRGPVASDSIFYTTGQRGIWFLRQEPDSKAGIYIADHPQRLTALSEAEKVRAYVKSIGAR